LPANQTKVRARMLDGPRLTSKYRVWNRDTGVTISEVNAAAGYQGKQRTVSEGHKWPPSKEGGLRDVGGPFYTEKSYVQGAAFPPFNATYFPSTTVGRQQSSQLSTPHPRQGDAPQYPTASVSTDAQLDALGATAIARCEPTNSMSNAVTFLGELMKEGLPHLISSSVWESRTDLARKSGSEYLNVQFGWIPILSDIQGFARAVSHADKVMSQYERDAGKVVRRRYSFPTVKTESEQNYRDDGTQFPNGFFSNNFPNMTVSGGPSAVKVKTEVLTERWFSGAFTYYLPSDYDSRKKMGKLAAVADKLFGVQPSPEDVWNLAPWSWAIDWFSNTGDVINNLGKFGTEGLVMPYGYMMEHSIVKKTYSYVGRSGIKPPYDKVPPISLVTESKKRREANPFGFGVSWDGLSSFQTSILAALGLSRGRR